MSVSIKVSDLSEILPPDLENLHDGRQRLVRYLAAGQNWSITQDMFPAYLTADILATNLLLVDIKLVDHRAVDPFGKLKHRKVMIATYEQLPAAGATPVQYGNPEVRPVEGAFKISGGLYKSVREFTYKYMVGGDGTTNADLLPENTRYYADLGNPNPAGEPERYFIEQRVVSDGIVMATIERVFVELPDTYTYTENITWQYPGIGVTNTNAAAFSDPITLVDAPATVAEVFTLGTPSPATPAYFPIQWAVVTETFIPVATGQTQEIVTGKPGYLQGTAGFTTSGTWLWRGMLVTGLSVSVSSSPGTYVPGESIELKQVRWKGNIWRTTTKHL